MPTVLRIGPYRFFFYAGVRLEPIHIHVERDASAAKFWLAPVILHSSTGFNRAEIGKIRVIVEKYQNDFTEAWHEYFGD